MSLILCIETGTDICSVAVARDGKLISLLEGGEDRDHARNLAVYTDEMLKGCDILPNELDAVAVSKGPGSYTGLRIGVSFAKGLCYALNIPLVAIGSLESLARVAAEEYEAGIIETEDWDNALLCPMIDARRMEVYTQVFDTKLNPLSEVSAEIITPESFGNFIDPDKEFIIFGSGAQKCIDILPEKGVKLINISASARGLCAAAQQKLNNNETEDAAYFEPAYLKDFIVTTSSKKLF